MATQERVTWMAEWCARNGATLELEGECGMMRECVGVTVGETFPDYEWYDEKTYERADENGDVWTPEDAYHKHPCVAVLGRGERAEMQLHKWLQWFDENGFTVESGHKDSAHAMHPIQLLMGQHKFTRMVRPEHKSGDPGGVAAPDPESPNEKR